MSTGRTKHNNRTTHKLYYQEKCRDKDERMYLCSSAAYMSQESMDAIEHLLMCTIRSEQWRSQYMYTEQTEHLFTRTSNAKFQFLPRDALVHSAVLRLHVVRPSVCPSVTLVDQDHIGWKSWKLIARSIRPTPLLFVDQRPSTYSQGNMGKFGGD